ncbi:MAG: hypothetical protein JNK67_15575 [Alphaproteobacteria bacterium]|nr:hypothetical protein [Alphaproteobacteria bacterium]
MTMVTRRRFALAGAGLIALGPSAGHASALPALTFTVLRDGSPIGTHRVDFARDGESLRVDIAIDLEVRMFAIPVYRYGHRSTERWRAGRLVGLSARTDDDGKRSEVRATAAPGGLVIEGSGGRFVAPADTKPTSYWHEDMTRRQRFLDTQNGTLLDVKVRPLGSSRALVAGHEIDMRSYELSGDLSSRLGYGPTGEWVELNFEARGSRIVYRRDAPPAAAAVSPAGPPRGPG